jgi:hypothetical protein
LKGKAVGPHLLGGFQKIENEEELSEIEKRDGSGSSKSQTLIERDELAIERIEKAAKDLCMAHKKGQN